MPQTVKEESTRERFAALDSGKQEKLLNPAESEFAQHGFNGASLNRILKDAGMSKGQAYYYIRDKADLYCMVCERIFARLTLAIGGWKIDDTSPETYWASIDCLFAKVMAICLQDTRIADIGRTVYASADAYQALNETMFGLQGFMIKSVRQGQAIGAVRGDIPEDLLASILFSHLNAIDRWFAENMSSSTPDELLRVNDVNRRLFRAMAEGNDAPISSH